MKTLLVFEMVPEDTRLQIVEGDYQHLQGVFINDSNADSEKVTELSDLIYTDDWDFKADGYNIASSSCISVDWLKSVGVEHIVFCGQLL